MIDVTIVPVPRQRNNREESDQVKAVTISGECVPKGRRSTGKNA
jgi:hypothetical protein